MTGTLWKLGGWLAAGFVALTMLLSGLERSALVKAAALAEAAPVVEGAAGAGGESGTVPTGAHALVFSGLVLLGLAVYGALTTWGGFLMDNPETRQIPVWLLLAITVVSGGAGLLGFAAHWGYVRSLDVVPTTVNEGYIAYQVMVSEAVLASLVLLGVRWAPGYRPRLLGQRP